MRSRGCGAWGRCRSTLRCTCGTYRWAARARACVRFSAAGAACGVRSVGALQVNFALRVRNMQVGRALSHSRVAAWAASHGAQAGCAAGLLHQQQRQRTRPLAGAKLNVPHDTALLNLFTR